MIHACISAIDISYVETAKVVGRYQKRIADQYEALTTVKPVEEKKNDPVVIKLFED